jgi:hypothetical protein
VGANEKDPRFIHFSFPFLVINVQGLWPGSAPSIGTADGTGFSPDIFLNANDKPSGIFVDLGGAPDPGLELSVQDRFQETPRVPGNPIDHPPALPDVLDQIGVSKDPKLVGDSGLLHFQDENELANAEVPLHEEQDKSQARRIRKGLKDLEKTFHFFILWTYEHIFI